MTCITGNPCLDTDLFRRDLLKVDLEGSPYHREIYECRECGVITEVDIPVGDLWVNAYEVDRCYGGHEEGGWWFDYGIAKASIPVDNWEEAEKEKLRVSKLERYSNEGRRDMHSVVGDSQFIVCIETHLAESYPQEKPHYE